MYLSLTVYCSLVCWLHHLVKIFYCTQTLNKNNWPRHATQRATYKFQALNPRRTPVIKFDKSQQTQQQRRLLSINDQQ